MLKISLRKAGDGDIKRFIEIEQMADSKTYSAMTTNKEWKDELDKENAKIYAIMLGDKIIGDVSYGIKENGVAYISGLCIDHELRGRGIGKQAIKIILEELENHKRIELVTHPENKNAIKLYLSFGFYTEKQMDNYFGDGEPRILMVKINN
jgi:ribosomal protein S18 acetylase RimI-like enzyme